METHPRIFTSEFCQKFEELIPIFQNLFQNIEEEETFSNHFVNPYYLDTKAIKSYHKINYMKIFHKHLDHQKNPQQNTSKLN